MREDKKRAADELDEELKTLEIGEMRTEILEIKDQLLRSKAEMENMRKRMKREIESAYQFAILKFVQDLLPAKDSLEKGLDIAYIEDDVDPNVLLNGVLSTIKIFNQAFKHAGVEEINPEGKPFDAEFQEALKVTEAVGFKPNTVMAVYQKGYLLNGRLVRPARVEVSKGLQRSH